MIVQEVPVAAPALTRPISAPMRDQAGARGETLQIADRHHRASRVCDAAHLDRLAVEKRPAPFSAQAISPYSEAHETRSTKLSTPPQRDLGRENGHSLTKDLVPSIGSTNTDAVRVHRPLAGLFAEKPIAREVLRSTC